MTRYILFYADGPGPRPPEISPEQLEAAIAEYVAWGENLPAGANVDGARLSSIWTDPGRIIAGHGEASIVTDGPFAETHEVVGGYGILEAASYDAVVALCRTHPHLRHGRIIIREIAGG